MAFVTTPCLQTSSFRRSVSATCARASVRRASVRRASVRHRAVVTARKAREVSAEEIERALQENARPLLIDAFATWCGPCQFLIPQLDIIAEKFGDRLDVLKFDTELYPELASNLSVRGLPTLFFVKDGKLRSRMEGALPEEQLEQAIEYILFDGPAPVAQSQPPSA